MTDNKESPVAIRNIVLDSTKLGAKVHFTIASALNLHIPNHHSFIENLAKKTIHNLVKFDTTNLEGKMVVSLKTEDASYDLSAFYTELTKHGYIIR